MRIEVFKTVLVATLSTLILLAIQKPAGAAYWNTQPGCARSIANNSSGVWVIGCDAGNDGRIWFLSIANLGTSAWVSEPGLAKQIAVGDDNIPWVVNSAGAVFRWNGSSWDSEPGCLTSISVAGKAYATGIGCDAGSDKSIWFWSDSHHRWTQLAGVAAQTSFTGMTYGNIYDRTAAGVVNEFSFSTFNWVQQTWVPCASQIAFADFASPMMTDCTNNSVWFWGTTDGTNYRWLGGSSGPAIAIAVPVQSYPAWMIAPGGTMCYTVAAASDGSGWCTNENVVEQ